MGNSLSDLVDIVNFFPSTEREVFSFGEWIFLAGPGVKKGGALLMELFTGERWGEDCRLLGRDKMPPLLLLMWRGGGENSFKRPPFSFIVVISGEGGAETVIGGRWTGVWGWEREEGVCTSAESMLLPRLEREGEWE